MSVNRDVVVCGNARGVVGGSGGGAKIEGWSSRVLRGGIVSPPHRLCGGPISPTSVTLPHTTKTKPA